MNYFPLFLNLAARRVLIVGGGTVGLRKLQKLLEAEAKITVVDPRPQPEHLSTAVEWLQAEFQNHHLEKAELVFACATIEVNRIVVAACKRRGLWVNSASEWEQGDFILPATARVGDIQLAISTGGQSPSKAVEIRDRLAEYLKVLQGERRA